MSVGQQVVRGAQGTGAGSRPTVPPPVAWLLRESCRDDNASNPRQKQVMVFNL